VSQDEGGLGNGITRAWLEGKFDLILYRLDKLEDLPERMRDVEKCQASLKKRINMQGGILGVAQAIGTALGIAIGPKQ